MATVVYATSADYVRLYLAAESSPGTLDDVTITISQDGKTATITSPDLVDQGDGTGVVVNLPNNIDVLLRSASRLVLQAIRTSWYDVDSNGLPSDTDQAEALVEATCAHVAAYVAAGITDPAAGGLTAKGVIASKSLSGGSISYDNSASSGANAFALRQALTATLCSEGRLILEDAGMLTTRVWTYG